MLKNGKQTKIILQVHFATENWQDQVYSDIDRDQLPVYWGGTMTDPDGDPACSSKVNGMFFFETFKVLFVFWEFK